MLKSRFPTSTWMAESSRSPARLDACRNCRKALAESFSGVLIPWLRRCAGFCTNPPVQVDSAMNLRISFLAKSRAPSIGTPPLPIAHFTNHFASLEDARKIAFADADKPQIRATLILIRSVDETNTEHRVHDGQRL